MPNSDHSWLHERPLSRHLTAVGGVVAAAALELLTTGAAGTQEPVPEVPFPGTRDGRAGWINAKDGTAIHYEDWSNGRPVVFSHGWPLRADIWEGQGKFVASHSFRAIAFVRRGLGNRIHARPRSFRRAEAHYPRRGRSELAPLGYAAAREADQERGVENLFGRVARADRRR